MAKPHEVWFGWMHLKQFTLKEDSHIPGYKKGDRVKAVMVSRMGDVGVTKKLDATNGYDLRVPPWKLEPTEPIPADICHLCHMIVSAFDHSKCSLERKCERCQKPCGPPEEICFDCHMDDFRKGRG